jgi:predicted RND superfamily exporter protein
MTSAVALLAGFALLTISSFEGFSQFGRVAIVLIITTAGGFLIFTPSWIILVERFRKHRLWPTSFADLVFERIQQAPSTIFVKGALVVRLLSIFIFPSLLLLPVLFLKFDYGFEERVPSSRALPADFQSGSVWVERTKPSAIAYFATPQEAARAHDFYEQNSKDYPDIVLMSSLSSFYPPDQEARIAKLQEIADEVDAEVLKRYKDDEIRRALLEIQEKAYEYQVFDFESVPNALTQAFVPMDGSGGSMLQMFDRGGSADGEKAMKFSAAVQKFFADQEIQPLYSGDEIIFGDIVKRVTQQGPWLILGMFFLVFVICFLDFRSWSSAFITLAPVLYGFIFTGAIMVLFGVHLNFFNMAALASLGAMVVDNSIHLYHRYREFKEEHPEDAGRMATYAVTPTVITCTMTSICGYGGMLFANHNGIASLGFVAVVGLLACLVSAVVFFPSWLITLGSKGRR